MRYHQLLRRSAFWRTLCGFAWLALLLADTTGLLNVDTLARLETWTYDVRTRAATNPQPDPRIVIVDIDERSLQEVGRWPWPRDRVAAVIEELLDRQQAALVAFDVVFAEPDESSGLAVLESLARTALKNQPAFQSELTTLRKSLDRDAILAQTMAGRPVLLGYYFNSGQGAVRSGMLPAPVFFAEDFSGRSIPFIHADGYGSNIPALQEAAAGAGHFTPLFDRDGLSRRVPLLIEFEGDLYESLSLAAARLYLGGALAHAQFGSANGDGYDAIEALTVGEFRIPVDASASALIPYHGPQGSFPYVSAVDLLARRLPAGSLANRIILIGTSAPGLLDLRATPVGNAYPGVEIHANMIAGILDGSIKAQPAYLLGFELLTLALAGGLLAVLLPRFGPAISVAATGAALAIIVMLSTLVWHEHNLVLPLARPLVAVIGVFLLNILYGLFVESRAKKQISGLFGQYVPPRVVEALAANPDSASMAGDTRRMTVLFSDVRNFTTISESLSAPELSRLMNAYLTAMTEVIQKHGGTIDKYIGDAIMAFWGAPLASNTHALDAVRAAIEMQQRCATLRQDFAARQWPELHIGIGINTGLMNVGNMGSQFRRAYTVMGDAVNLGARLESLTKQYGADILVGEESARAAEGSIGFRELDRICVKGKHQAVSIFEPLAASPAPQPGATQEQQLGTLEQMISAYRNRQWEHALELLGALERGGDHPELISLYRRRIATHQEQAPPADWDGSFAFEAK